MNVLLIEPQYGFERARPWVPIGKAHLASVLRAAGLAVTILDNALREYDDERLAAAIRECKPDIVGTGGMTLQFNDMKRIARVVRRTCGPDVLLVGGGVHLTIRPQDGLEHFDFVVVGEGEATFLELCKAYAELRNKTDDSYRTIAGLCFASRDGQIVQTPPRDFIRDLDRLPMPAYDLLAMEEYNDFLITGEKAISILTGRGCPYCCEFCASPLLSRRQVRYFSLEYTFGVIEHLVRRFGCSNLRIMDDTFAANRRRVLDFCGEIGRRNLALNMTCLTHVRTCDADMCTTMRKCGFSVVALGIESGNDRILKLINKGISRDDAAQAVGNAKNAGLMVEGLFMIGNIGETRETVEDTIRFAKQHNPPYRGFRRIGFNYFQFATPFPGSSFFDKARDYGTVVSVDYDRYSHQEPLFIPAGLDAATMATLREEAARVANSPSLPKPLVKFVKKIRRTSAKLAAGIQSRRDAGPGKTT